MASTVNLKRSVKTAIRMVSKPWSTERRIASDVERLGVRPGGILLVHSSLSALGYVPGGIPSVIRALLRAVGSEGTLVLPTHSWEVVERKGCRSFDAQKTPSCVGNITEYFRLLPGVKRSLHPTHSVAAIGPRAGELTSGHELCPTPCGSGTPYDLVLRSGQVLFLGATLDSNTAFHTIEAMANLPYLLNDQSETFSIVDEEGRSKEISVRRHRAEIPRRFRPWEGTLEANGVLKAAIVGCARSLLVDGKAFLTYMLDAVGKDPASLLLPVPKHHSD